MAQHVADMIMDEADPEALPLADLALDPPMLSHFSRQGINEDNTAELYAQRDIELRPNQSILVWRKEIDDLLESGAPYGKPIGWKPNLDHLFVRWKDNLAGLPKDTSPFQVYAAASEQVLSFLGY